MPFSVGSFKFKRAQVFRALATKWQLDAIKNKGAWATIDRSFRQKLSKSVVVTLVFPVVAFSGFMKFISGERQADLVCLALSSESTLFKSTLFETLFAFTWRGHDYLSVQIRHSEWRVTNA